jgi:hypothetical protein
MTQLCLAAITMVGPLGTVCHAQLIIESLAADVTQNEVRTFIDTILATRIPTSQWSSTVTHNQLAHRNGGATLEAINDMCVVTADNPDLMCRHKQLLDLAIQWTDTWLIYRNDMPLGEGRACGQETSNLFGRRTVPPAQAPLTTKAKLGTVGHMAYTAYNILNTPSIWDDTVPDLNCSPRSIE